MLYMKVVRVNPKNSHYKEKFFLFLKFCLFSFIFCPFRAAPTAYGGSQARGPIGAVAARPTPEPQQCQIQAVSVTYPTVHGNARPPTH